MMVSNSSPARALFSGFIVRKKRPGDEVVIVFGCQKPKKCTKSKDKKNPRHSALPPSVLPTELILPGAVSPSRVDVHRLY